MESKAFHEQTLRSLTDPQWDASVEVIAAHLGVDVDDDDVRSTMRRGSIKKEATEEACKATTSFCEGWLYWVNETVHNFAGHEPDQDVQDWIDGKFGKLKNDKSRINRNLNSDGRQAGIDAGSRVSLDHGVMANLPGVPADLTVDFLLLPTLSGALPCGWCFSGVILLWRNTLMEATSHYVYDYEGAENALRNLHVMPLAGAEADALAQEHYPDMLDNLVELTVDGVTVSRIWVRMFTVICLAITSFAVSRCPIGFLRYLTSLLYF